MNKHLLKTGLYSLLLAFPVLCACGQSPEGRVAVGAIRWDAWYDGASDINRAVQQSLSPKPWQWRLPFFATVATNGAVAIAGDTDEVMAREIHYARTAGLDYWAFCAYDDGSSMSRALHRYLKHPARDQVHFCLIADVNHWPPEKCDSEASRFADLMKLPNYQTVLQSRPLIYILNLAIESNARAWAPAGGFQKAITALRDAAHARAVANPYCVVMVPWPDKAGTFAVAAGCDAISAYAVQAGGRAAPYAELTAYVEDFWQRSLDTGAKVVPLAMTGWDRRPRVDTPVFWEHNEGWNADCERYYLQPKPQEIAGHIRKAVDWTRTHPAAVEAQTVIIYAWNEHDEGGWLCPTLGEGDARIQAMTKALR
ncbi:MAG TPA: hypothetical protein VF988_17520 [Verrucomicrobiae bacterium]